ncbi:UNVERIFIED_CONTAM: DEAD-box ATP-dependent RNA helicase 57 [Sesamum calycinum]|uniref:RNA helicase n=1 Tax=Sesamum calycinum TaxID=2727403 RepID=A0AAW2MZP7_9LAMI
MEKDTSFLFSGITFNRKKFASDFARFKEKTESDDVVEKPNLIENGSSSVEKGMAVRADKKRKRKVARSDPVEGFSVFKRSKSKAVDEAGEHNEDEILQEKKEYYRQLEGRECFACAPTGSGKTFAFVCPILMKLKHASKDGVRAVILCPTRELAAQTARECKKLAKGKKFYIKLMTKQLAKSADFSKLPCDILISTPFRIQFAIRKRKLDLSKVEVLVLDESDKLFELGLVEQVDAVVKACSNPSILRSLFSATLPDTVEELARTIMHDAVRVIIGRKNSASESIKQKLIFVGSEEGKLLALRQSFAESLNPPVLLFVQNKERAKELYNELKYDDIRADVIHADLSQIQREHAIDNFRSGKTWVLIATDVIARGMDFKGVNCVINYDFPDSAAAYIHRIGRSGRAGRSGEAITLYTEADVPFLRNVANVMTASGCVVPEWILSLPKKKWRKHRPQRESISTKSQDEN